MSTAAQVSVWEYLHTEYEPDCEYLDGVLVDRNVGKKKHSRTQTRLSAWLLAQAEQHGYDTLVEQRIRFSGTRYRIPDICLVPLTNDEIPDRPPVLWVEVLSPEDRWSRVRPKLEDCLRFGVRTIWVIDPYSKKAWMATQAQPIAEVADGRLRCEEPQLEVLLSEILPTD